MSSPALLAVFAHPDDESLACGGLLARCADGGAHVSLLCLTHGEHGPGQGAEPLREARARELADAARVLGIRDVVLLDHADGMIPWIEPALVEADILDAIRRFRPDVVITFDEDGLYWHPDHIAVHARTTEAVARLGPDGPALVYVSMPAGAMRALVEAEPGPATLLGVADPDAFGSMAPLPTLVFDAGSLASRKLAALRCHRSQVAGGALERLDDERAARFLGIEHYRRAAVGSRAEAFIEQFRTPVGSGLD